MSNPITRAFDRFTAPDPATAEAKAAQARQAVIEAQAGIAAARAALVTADEAGQGQQQAEAALIAAERAADRAGRDLDVAERRLQAAQAAAAAEAQRDGKAQLDDMLALRGKAIAKIDEAIAQLADALAEIDRADVELRQLQQQGVMSPDAVAGHNFGGSSVRRRVELSLENAKVLTGAGAPSMSSLSAWHELLATTARG